MKKLWIITLFAIAMGYLESAVVVYLREIFYPEGFAFPLKSLTGHIALTEILREAATLIMLAAIGYLSGRGRLQRFGVFLYAFGTWDIFYYIFLKFLMGWPESLLTWDILFLIPVTWVGPVAAPVINALTMSVFGVLIFIYSERDPGLRIRRMDWALLILGSLIIIFAYTQDYLRFIQDQMPLISLFKPSDANVVMEAATRYVPEKFNWWIFGFGQGIIMMAVFRFTKGSSERVRTVEGQPEKA